MQSPAELDFESWVCPVPLRETPSVVMGHGGGGAMSGELIEHLFLPAYGAAAAAELGDSAVLSVGGGPRLAFSTDSYVVKPMFFPGGSIGDLAVNGTVNDLAMSGAVPLFLSTAFILQEGTALDELGRIAEALGAAARSAGFSWSPGTPRSSTAPAVTASSSTPPGSVWCPTASTSARAVRAPVTRCSSAVTSACTGWR